MKNRKMKILLPVALLSISAVAAIGVATGASAASDSLYGSKKAFEWVVVYNLCDGTGKVEYARGTVGTEIDLLEPVREGYAFLGWSTKYSASKYMGTEADIIDSKYTIDAKNVVLYAVWKKGSSSHTSEEIDAYMDSLQSSSQDGHIYIHYYRWNHNPVDYGKWDIWAWPYRPNEGEGYNFDFDLSKTDDFGGAVCDIDMTKTYDGGWDNVNHKVGGTEVKFMVDGELQKTIGIQFVRKADRQDPESKFWGNDGGNIYVDLEDVAYPLNGGGTAYHLFAVQDSTQAFTNRPLSDEERVDPFENDDGNNVTKGDNRYDNVDWNDKQKMATAPDWKKIGVGYQIMISSFADSDGDGFGDIYGITQKLDYLDKLGVKALWLTPVQKSDSYHGYDISDYEAVDMKFGSAVSPAGIANKGVVTDETAMADYEELIQKAGEKGMKIVMDLVLNHTSTSNKWFISSGQLDPDYRGYYQWANHEKDPEHINQDASWYPYGDHCYSYYAKFGSGMPELNYSFKSTREAVEEMSLFWCAKGVAGFRLDAVKHIFMKDECNIAAGDTIINDIDEAKNVDYSSDLTKNLNFYKELNYAVKSQYPDVFFVGENFDGNAYQVGPYYEAFDSMFDFYTYFNLTSQAAMGAGSNVGGYASGWMRGNGTFDKPGKEYNGVDCIWNAVDVFKAYDTWRGGKALPGCFTSNHDIARTINRVAGTGTSTGLTAQGKITTGNYDKWNKSAMCVKLATILMPGVSWIYYGDEIGMTGNFLMNAETDQDDYADLGYRQPMKWTSSGVVGDGSYTTGFAINGAKTNIYMDEVNASSKVVPATSQEDNANSDFSILAKAIKLKHDNPEALITGSFADANTQDTELRFSRSGGGKTFTVDINWQAQTVTVKQGTQTVFTY